MSEKNSIKTTLVLGAILFVLVFTSCLTGYTIQPSDPSVGDSGDTPRIPFSQSAPDGTVTPNSFTLNESTDIPVPIGERSYADRPDDYPSMYQIHIVYALFQEQDDLERDLDSTLAKSIQLANEWFLKQSDGSRLRFDTYQGELDITFVQFDMTKNELLESFRPEFDKQKESNPGLVIEDFYLPWIAYQLADRGFSAPGKYYVVYLETAHPHSCGRSFHSDNVGVLFLQTRGCGYARLGVDKYAWNNEFIMLHEMLHGLGFIFSCAPHFVKNRPAHVNDSDRDLMYPYADKIESAALDVNHDDYFMHNIPDCPDLANSAFLEPLPANPEPPYDWPERYLLPE